MLSYKNAVVVFIFTALILSLALYHCSGDHGLEPIRSYVQGVITYSGEWPAPPAEVRLVAATSFPPSGISDLIIGESIPLTGSSYEYYFYLDPGTYKLVGVAWRAENSIWDIMSICGLHFEGDNPLSPSTIVLASDTSRVKNINISVDRADAKKITNTKIFGTIKFEGAWPDSIIDVRVIATDHLRLYPLSLPSLLDISFSDGIPVGTDSVGYVIKAFPATYVATGVIFFKSGQSLSEQDIYYSLNIGGLSITPYTVVEDSTIHGPDFFIKF